MHEAHEFLKSLTIVLAVAAVTTVLFQRLRQPVVLGYIIAGLIVGPHVPVPLVADRTVVQTLSELGVILLMFSLGLEFSLGKLRRVGPSASLTALIQSSLVAWLGFLGGRLLGWTPMESVFAGAIVAISSTTIIAKVFDERGVHGRQRELVVGILLIEDLIAIVFMAALTAVASGAGLSARALGATVGQLAVFLTLMLILGMLLVPRSMRYVMRIGRPETTLVASIGICFGLAYVAQAAGYSVALGAFLAGSLIAESGSGEDIEHLVRPVRDMFAAIFFVSVGLLIDPALVARHWPAVALFVGLVVTGKVVSVSVGAFLTGNGVRTSVQAGMSLAQIGEFSFIIAGLGITLGAVRDFLYPVAVAVSAVTTLTTPWLIGAAEPVAALVDRKLPRGLQTFSTLYGAWLERLRASGETRRSTGVRRVVRLLAVDALILSVIIIAAALEFELARSWLRDALGLSSEQARFAVIGLAMMVAAPLVFGIFRLSRRLGSLLAEAALPRRGAMDLELASRRVLLVALQLVVALLTGGFVVAVTQPFLPGYWGALILAVLVAGMGLIISQRAAYLEGHVRAGAQAVVQSLAKYARGGRQPLAATAPALLADVHAMLPGLGAPIAVAVTASSPCVGRTLAELNLRGRTGATVLGISRKDESIVVPPATERIRVGDVLAIAGTSEAVAAARAALEGDARNDG